MKLSSKEATALAAAELRADAPANILKRESGLREHALRYAIQRLKQRGVCIPLLFINLHALGFTTLNIFFTIGAQKKAANEALLKAFFAAPDVVWVGEFGGEYQYGIAVCTSNLGQSLDLINSLSSKFKHLFFDKAISIQHSATVYPRRYLSAKRFSSKQLSCRYTKDITKLDELDRKILIAAAEPGEASHRDLSRKLGVPASTIDLRMRKLTEVGVVIGKFLAVDCTKYGFISFKLLIYAKGMNPDLARGLATFCENHPNVTYLIECLGSWDYEMGVEVANNEEVTHIMQEIFEEFGSSVNTVKILTKFRDLKFRWFPGA